VYSEVEVAVAVPGDRMVPAMRAAAHLREPSQVPAITVTRVRVEQAELEPMA